MNMHRNNQMYTKLTNYLTNHIGERKKNLHNKYYARKRKRVA